jgi:hypothetical protein
MSLNMRPVHRQEEMHPEIIDIEVKLQKQEVRKPKAIKKKTKKKKKAENAAGSSQNGVDGVPDDVE